MKLLALAVASIVDANTNQGHTRQILGSSQTRIVEHIERGRHIRSKSITDLLGKLSSAVSRFIENAKARAENRKAVEQLLRMNDHMLRDIGLTYNDVKSVDSGLISLDDLAERRQSDRASDNSISRIRKNVVDDSIRKLESANEDCFELAKCS